MLTNIRYILLLIIYIQLKNKTTVINTNIYYPFLDSSILLATNTLSITYCQHLPGNWHGFSESTGYLVGYLLHPSTFFYDYEFLVLADSCHCPPCLLIPLACKTWLAPAASAFNAAFLFLHVVQTPTITFFICVYSFHHCRPCQTDC
jgi:hypothetical protein